MEIAKQSIGIDVSKNSLDVVFKELSKQQVKIKGSRKFKNNSDGFRQLLEWCNKREKCESIVYIIEATGVYHENLLHFLYDSKKMFVLNYLNGLSILLKAKVSKQRMTRLIAA